MERKPEWLRAKVNPSALKDMQVLLRSLSLHTVCESADCPNRGECFKAGTATFMILGNTCTRNCRFCAVEKGRPASPDPTEPEHLAEAAKKLGLKHVVVTSVTRDDLPDGGAEHFAQTIYSLKQALPESSVEVLIPDLKGSAEALNIIINAKPDIINHNLETVKSLYSKVRPQAVYERSLELLERVRVSGIYSKTGIMVGLGETEEQVFELLADIAKVGCGMLTIGQYLRPSESHIPVVEYVPPERFEKYKEAAIKKGIKYVASSPLVRSSYNAIEGMNEMRKAK
jgi:lipoyl synthase